MTGDRHESHPPPAAFVVGDFDSGLTFASRAYDGLRQLGLVALLTQALVLRTFFALYLGRWDITHVASDEAYQFAVETRQPVWAACAQLGQANVAGLRGDHDRTTSLAADVEQTALAAGNRALLNGVQLSRGLAALGAERPEEAFTEFSRMMDRTDPAYQSPHSAPSLRSGDRRAWPRGGGAAGRGRAAVALPGSQQPRGRGNGTGSSAVSGREGAPRPGCPFVAVGAG